MKKHMIQLAGLTLAAVLYAPATLAQVTTTAVAAPPPQQRRVEIELDGEDGPLALARSGVGEAVKVVRKLLTVAGGAESGERPLIISSSSVDEKSLATLDEDMTIMGRILD